MTHPVCFLWVQPHVVQEVVSKVTIKDVKTNETEIEKIETAVGQMGTHILDTEKV